MTERRISEMVHNQRPVVLGSTATVADACRLMHDRRLGAILVTNPAGQLEGIFTGRDAVRLLAQGIAADRPLRGVMTAAPCTMKPGGTAIEALRLMEDGGFRHLPVVDGERLIGIVSWGDFRTAEHDRLDTEIGYWERM